jgi:hypothetical protein
MGVGGQRHATAALPPGKTQYPLSRRLGGPQGPSGQVRKTSPPIRSPDRPARSESLYRLRYPGPKRNLSSAENIKESEESGLPTIVLSNTCIKRNLLGTEKRNSFPFISVIVLHCIISWTNHDVPAPWAVFWTALKSKTRHCGKLQFHTLIL